MWCKAVSFPFGLVPKPNSLKSGKKAAKEGGKKEFALRHEKNNSIKLG
jgi:hypothetical protein